MQRTLGNPIDTIEAGDPWCLEARRRAIGTSGRPPRDVEIRLRRETEAMEKHGWRYWPCRDSCIGRRLGAEAPEVLIVQGIPDLSIPRVAVVGPRRPDDYGLEMAAFFAGALGRCGVAVVSGGAAGIDTAAHEACLGAGGLTFCVLGCGFLMPFPEDNAPLFSSLGRVGGNPESCLISEYSPGMPAQPHQFPQRNRIVAALSDAVVVIQAGYPSGALITARLAVEMGVPVFAVPADIHWKGSSGTNDLLGRGALAICRPGDLEAVPELRGCGLADVRAKQVPRPHGMKSPWQRSKAPVRRGAVSRSATAILAEIVRIHGETGCGADMERLAGTGGGAAGIQAGLLELELAGLVERMPGGVVVPVSRRC